MNKSSRLILMGYCPNPHGIRGGLSFFPINKEDSILESGTELFLKSNKNKNSDNKYRPYKIIELNKGNKWILFLDKILDRNQAELLTPAEIYCERTIFPELHNESEFYLADLIGLKVLSFETGEILGKCLGHYHNGAQYVLVLELQNEKLELPFIEYFFPEINLVSGEIKIRRPEVLSE